MIKYLNLTLLLLCTSHCFAQQDWVEVKISGNVSVKMPSNHTKLDTLGAVYFMAQSEASGYLVSYKAMPKEVVEGTTLRNEDQLSKLYEAIVDEFKEQGLRVDHNEIVDWRGFLVLKLNHRIAKSEGEFWQEQWQITFSTESYGFAVTCTEEWLKDPIYLQEKSAFFDGIHINSEISRDDQYNLSGFYRKIGELIGSVSPYVLGAIVFGVVMWIQKRKRQRIKRELQAREDGF